MMKFREWHGCDVALAMALSVSALTACGAENGAEGSDANSDADEPLATAEQPVIPGASIFQVVRSVHLPADDYFVSQTVSCPAGSVIVGGGHYISVGSNVRVNSSYSAENAWRLSAVNLSETQATGVDIYAQCLSGTRATVSERWSAYHTVDAGATFTSSVNCPAGTVLAGGGYQASQAFHASRSGPVVSGGVPTWVVTVKNTNTLAPTGFSSMAICVGGVRGRAQIRGETTPAIPPGGQVTFHSSACPAGTLLSSGGYYFPGAASPSVARGTRRNAVNPAKWTAVLVNKATTSISPFVHTICLDLLQ